MGSIASFLLISPATQGLFSRVPPAAKAVKPRLYATIDRATSPHLSAPNLSAYSEVEATINSAFDPSYASTKACKRILLRIRTRNQRVQYLALLLLEHCVRSCGERFHSELAASELLQELSRMADRSLWCATDIQRLILAMIQEWAYEIRDPRFSELFNRLKRLNLPFEPRGAGMEMRLQPYPGYYQQVQPQYAGGTVAQGAGRRPQPQHHPQRGRISRPSPPAAAAGSSQLGPELLQPERSSEQLLSDLEVARGTVALLNEVLDGIESERSWSKVKEEYCGEVASATSAVSQRLQNLLGSNVSNERVIALSLSINDDAQKALSRRLEYIEIADGKRQAPPPRPTSSVETQGDQPQSGQQSTGPQESRKEERESVPPLLDLLSLDVEPTSVAEKPSEADNAANGVPPQGSQTVAESSAMPASRPPPSNNPFAAAVADVPKPVSESMGQNEAQEIKMEETAAPSNPFLNDAAFATTMAAPKQSLAGAEADKPITYPKVEYTAATSSGGNPFASPDAPGTENTMAAGTARPETMPSSAGYHMQRPPPVSLPVETQAPFAGGAFTAPAGTNSSGHIAQYGPPSASSINHAGYFSSQQQTAGRLPVNQGLTNAPGPSSIYSPSTNSAGLSTSFDSSKKGIDAFSGLVALTPKRDEAPAPPK